MKNHTTTENKKSPVNFPIFLSIVIIIGNETDLLKLILSEIVNFVSPIVSDYEIIIINNTSNNKNVSILESLTGKNGFPNLQIFSLIKEVDIDTAFWVGVENSLGDFVVTFDQSIDDIKILPKLIAETSFGPDIVFAYNTERPKQPFVYKAINLIFSKLYKYFNGVDLRTEFSQYRIMSRKLINFISQHPQPNLIYRLLPFTSGFEKKEITYHYTPIRKIDNKNISNSIDRGFRILVTSSRLPMRLVTWISLIGAIANLFYSFYVGIILLLREDVAPGWASLSLQQSGMFFLLSLALLVLGEYILQMASLSNNSPEYFISKEYTSTNISRKIKINIHENS